jgi:hypothetical protein
MPGITVAGGDKKRLVQRNKRKEEGKRREKNGRKTTGSQGFQKPPLASAEVEGRRTTTMEEGDEEDAE